MFRSNCLVPAHSFKRNVNDYDLSSVFSSVTDVEEVALSRLMVVSCEAKKKQHAHASFGQHNHYSKLFTRMAALKFENAVTQSL